ncbi:MAG: DUF3387 domain-containing protein [Peptostreptococcaceae bacterium]
MSDEILEKIARELSDTIRKQVNVDYNVRANLQSGMRYIQLMSENIRFE